MDWGAAPEVGYPCKYTLPGGPQVEMTPVCRILRLFLLLRRVCMHSRLMTAAFLLDAVLPF
jgi:hypothetical protein